MIAGIAAIAAYIAAALMTVLVVLGLVHRRRLTRAASIDRAPTEAALS
jgi:hypothetical protein